MLEFQRVKRPPKLKSGFLVIHSDDGLAGDITHWQPLFEEKNKKYNGFGKTIVPFCVAINSNNTGTRPSYMYIDDLKKIERMGGEIMSHGVHHIGLLPNRIVEEVSAGATTLKVSAIGRVIVREPLEYIISNNEKSEIVTVVSSDDGNAHADGNVYIDSPLKNSYDSGATFRATNKTIQLEMEGCKNDIESWGLKEVKNHVYPWNQNDEIMRTEASKYFETASASNSDPINEYGGDVYALYRADIMESTKERIINLIQECGERNGVLIFYSHAQKTNAMMEKLDLIVETAINTGVKIITQKKAANILK